MSCRSVRLLSSGGLCVLLMAAPAFAASEAVNCAAEPADTTIGYGVVLNGLNCALNPATDVDVVRFAGSAGEVVRIAVSNNGGPGGLLAEIRDPDGVLLFTISNPVISVGMTRALYVTLAKTGTYGVTVFDAGLDQMALYGVVVERVAPAGPDAVPIAIGTPIADEINPPNDIDLFRFQAAAGSLIRVSIDPTFSVVGQNAMLQAVSPSGAPYTSGEFSDSKAFFADVAVSETGMQTIQIRAFRTDFGPFSYSVRIDCISGPCSPPDCTLEVAPAFDAGTLSLGFQIGNRLGAAMWNVWVSIANQTIPLWSIPVGNIDPMVNVSVPIPGIPHLGGVALVSTITTSARGIVCMDAETVETGAVASGAAMPSAAALRQLFAQR
ncbi:MAG TPA: hypothetical protein VH417_06365 [Vicinamibacterales bacterium]